MHPAVTPPCESAVRAHPVLLSSLRPFWCFPASPFQTGKGKPGQWPGLSVLPFCAVVLPGRGMETAAVGMETAEPFLQAFANRAHSLWVAGKKPLASLDPEHFHTLKGVCPGHFNTLGQEQAMVPGMALSVTAAPVLTAMTLHWNAAKEGHSLMLYFPLPLHLPWQAEHSQGEQQRATHFLTGKCHT